MLVIVQLVKEFIAKRRITVFTRDRHRSPHEMPMKLVNNLTKQLKHFIIQQMHKYRVAQKMYTLFTHQYLWNKFK